MPTPIKIIVSILTLIVGALFFYFESRYGQQHLAVVGFGLSVVMVISMWLFSETSSKKSSS
jgi:Na+/phosphate symporter